MTGDKRQLLCFPFQILPIHSKKNITQFSLFAIQIDIGLLSIVLQDIPPPGIRSTYDQFSLLVNSISAIHIRNCQYQRIILIGFPIYESIQYLIQSECIP